MKKYLIIIAMLALVLAPALSQAYTIPELQVLIARLQAQLAAMQNNQSTTGWCHTFNSDIKFRDNNDEVSELESALEKNGINIPFFPNSEARKYFNAATSMNVKEFQKKYGIPQTGYVGPLTRARLNKLYGCANNNSTISINSVSGPTSLAIGQTGTWGLNVTAPSNTNLTYSVDWGEISSMTQATGVNPTKVNQGSTFTHAYSQAGAYTVKFKVSDDGLSACPACPAGAMCKTCDYNKHIAEASLTVVVGGVSQKLSITYPADPANWHDYVGQRYDKVFTVSPMSSFSYTWAITSGSLPSGLSIQSPPCPNCPSCGVCASANGSSIRIVGIPTQAGNFPFTLNVRDSLGNTGSLGLNINIDINNLVAPMKPVIYLYPQKIEVVKVQLDYAGKLIADYPAYDPKISGWEVTAYPDGRLINKADGKEYSYLFWEGNDYEKNDYNLSTGFVVKGSDSRAFLQNTLAKMGLTPKEYNEFIVYWYPKMENNAYNLIHFAGQEYTDRAKLTISPTPDSILRVFMVLKPLDQAIKVTSQEIKSFNRKGFAVIEWGGAELSK